MQYVRGFAHGLFNSETIGSLSRGGGSSGGNVTLGNSVLTVGANNTSTSFGGIISGSGGLTKTGSGTLDPDRIQYLQRRHDGQRAGTLQVNTANSAGTGMVTLGDANTGASNVALVSADNFSVPITVSSRAAARP